MTTEQVIKKLLDIIGNGLVVASLGNISKALYNVRIERKEEPNDFYVLGAMGHVISIGLGIALNTNKQVFVLIGDGSLLMKLGSLATCAACKLDNLHIVIINNNKHQSCGGQKTNFWAIRHFINRCRHCHIIDVNDYGITGLIDIELKPTDIVWRFMRRCQNEM